MARGGGPRPYLPELGGRASIDGFVDIIDLALIEDIATVEEKGR